ncbi:MAG: hypothetical protein LBC18_10810 [Opitutaceae bacterium]|jgi:hypothetical protein|nr:hypothetical protein [Opitutaceae bacterium]
MGLLNNLLSKTVQKTQAEAAEAEAAAKTAYAPVYGGKDAGGARDFVTSFTTATNGKKRGGLPGARR